MIESETLTEKKFVTDSLKALLPGLAAHGLSRFQLHAVLYRLCLARVPDLWNLRREPAEARLLEIEAQLRKDLDEPDWASRVHGRSRWGGEDQALLWAGALLRALDDYHRIRHQRIAGKEAEIPLQLGGGTALFLPPPLRPIEDLVPVEKRLKRDAEDYGNKLWAVLDLWWHLVFPQVHAVELRREALPPDISQELALRLRTARDLRLGISSPFANLGYEVRADATRCHPSKGRPYHFTEISPSCLDAARGVLGEIVSHCACHRIDLLCFPELTLDTSLLRALSQLLRDHNETLHPALVVAGTFHLDSATGTSRVNRCQILDGYGQPLFSQEKRTAYSILGEQVQAMDETLQKQMGLDGQGGYEDIDVSRSFLLIEGALGRMAVPICLDYCGEDLRDLLIETQTNFLAVSAMTTTLEPFYARARELGTLARATTS